MLGKAMRKYVMEEKKEKYSKEKRNVYDYRLKKYAVQALKDLALLAEKLPEKQQSEIFSVENTSPFLRTLFSLESDDVEKRKRRVIGLWHALFSNLSTTYGLKLVSREVWQVLASQPIPHIQAIYYATLFRESQPSGK
jgi:hypothetical protein